ncbi:MAG: hypothetical protein LBL72_06715 [Candidatus Accumulibacter sp.]|nr:hypothetical protein [Accumulibacter sp.]
MPLTPDADLLAESGLFSEEVKGFDFRQGKGCGHCRGTGYKGRKAVAEFLVLNDRLREMIASRRSVIELKEEARRTGTKTLRESAMKLVASGETTLQESTGRALRPEGVVGVFVSAIIRKVGMVAVGHDAPCQTPDVFTSDRLGIWKFDIYLLTSE